MNEAIEHELAEEGEENKTKLEVFETVQDVMYQPAKRWKRIVAFFLDAIFLSLINLSFGHLITIFGLEGSAIEGILVSYLFSFAFTYLYYVVSTYKYQATPGKKLLGLKVMNKEKTSQLGMLQLILREIPFKFVGGIFFMIGYLYFFFDREARALHDIWSKTIVVEEE